MTTVTHPFMQRDLPVTTSPVAVFLTSIRWTMQSATGKRKTLSAINARLTTDRDEFLRLAELNTLNKTGRSRL